MTYKNLLITKVPKASRHMQIGTIKVIETRFEKLIQTPAKNTSKDASHYLYLSKELLIDIRHILLYYTFDHDIRTHFFHCAMKIISYLHAFMNALQKQCNINTNIINKS
jgi:hypothetical protein